MPVRIRRLGRVDYPECYRAMRAFSLARQPGSVDELWCLEHPPVFTLGMNGRPEHLLDPGAIPVIRTDRGGQVTYHGPGQLIIYCLLEMRGKPYGVKALVQRLEQAVIDVLDECRITAARVAGAPGVYVDGKKIAALGIRVKRGYAWHGLALNVDMDLSPYRCINPCGYAGLEITQLSDLGVAHGLSRVTEDVSRHVIRTLELNGRTRPGSLPEIDAPRIAEYG
ncbi:MAG: lipoyl(octanoyl) transferase LipB [Thiotrichales bacterium]|nr:lipoyl(octanoyl) transferase LipB [Thiotrichales bacterium]